MVLRVGKAPRFWKLAARILGRTGEKLKGANFRIDGGRLGAHSEYV
jgi:hypothetical protein